MAAPGDSLLLRSGMVRAEVLIEAQRLRARSGGTVGEWLVRLGAVTEEQLVDFYHRRLLVPRVESAQFARPAPDALAAVSADMAAEFRVFPISIDADKALTLAMADPADTHVAEEVAFYSGRFCHRAVAAASAIQQAIERHYRHGARTLTPRSFAGPPIAGAAKPSIPRRYSAPTQPLRTLEVVEDPIVLLTHVKDDPSLGGGPHTEEAADPQHQGDPAAQQRNRTVTQPRLGASQRDAAPSPPSEKRTMWVAPPAKRSHARTLPGIPLLPELPLELFRVAETRDGVANALLDYAAQVTSMAVLLVMRKGFLVGHDGRGSVDTDAARRISVSIAQPSLFRDVVQSRLPYRGAVVDGPGHRPVLEIFGRFEGEALLLPISVMDRVIAVLFAANVMGLLPDISLHALGREAGVAYERLIRSSRG